MSDAQAMHGQPGGTVDSGELEFISKAIAEAALSDAVSPTSRPLDVR